MNRFGFESDKEIRSRVAREEEEQARTKDEAALVRMQQRIEVEHSVSQQVEEILVEFARSQGKDRSSVERSSSEVGGWVYKGLGLRVTASGSLDRFQIECRLHLGQPARGVLKEQLTKLGNVLLEELNASSVFIVNETRRAGTYTTTGRGGGTFEHTQRAEAEIVFVRHR